MYTVLKSIWSKNTNTSAKKYLKYSRKYSMLKVFKIQYIYKYSSHTSNYNKKNAKCTLYSVYFGVSRTMMICLSLSSSAA